MGDTIGTKDTNGCKVRAAVGSDAIDVACS